MPLDNVGPSGERPEEAAWGASGRSGVKFQVNRFPDGSAQFCTFQEMDTQSQAYALHVSAEGVMSMLDFLLNRPAASGSMN